jgi:hypothetical protein
VLENIFGSRREEATECLKRLHNEELHDLHYSSNIIRVIKSRKMKWVGHAARMGEKRNAYRVLAGKPEGKRPHARPRRRWEENIKLNLKT